MEDRPSFYLTLPSNSCLSIFPDNQSSDYTVMLSRPIELRGPYEVALAEIMYCYTWRNIPYPENGFELRDTELEAKRAADPLANLPIPFPKKIKSGYYESVKQIVSEINAMLKKSGTDVSFTYSEITRRVIITGNQKYKIQFKPTLAYMLGFEPGHWYNLAGGGGGGAGGGTGSTSPYPSDIHAGFYNMYVYCNIVEPQHVGEFVVPLLRTVKIVGRFGDVVTLPFHKLHYVPLNKQSLQNLHIEIKNDQNTLINFSYGKTIVKLHFRPVPKIPV